MGTLSIKLIGLVGMVAITSLLVIKQNRVTHQLEKVSAELLSNRIQQTKLISANQSLQQTITQLEQQALQEQQAAKQAEQARQVWQQRAEQAKQQIEKDISHEECADLPIPNAAHWMYYDTATGDHSVQN
ncbi:hypothetical protein [Photobacterium damselae]|uniref:hypothetical protein n=1 Tax=Photobacterium damselae TaxID=38293 RepID=UPI001F3560FF|nr:hypothetical protein [Photobacterium damselae]UKA08976.1 hypothetical protein IHC91_07995 [Photobacterium damselae subsp. damselae]